MTRREQKAMKERLSDIENFSVQGKNTKADNNERKRGQKTWGNPNMESVQRDKKRVQRKWVPAVPVPVPNGRAIECKSRPKPDLTPEYGLEPKADPAPRHRADKENIELLDIENEECEDEQLPHRGNNKIMSSSNLEEAQHKFQKKAEEARHRVQTRARESDWLGERKSKSEK